MGARRVVVGKNIDAKQTELDLLRTVGNELKNPLTHMAGTISLLKSNDFKDREIPEQLERMEISTKRMLSLIDGLLYVGRVRTHQVELEFEPVNVASIVREVVAETNPIALRHHRQLSTTITNELTPAAADKTALKFALGGIMDVVVRSSKSEVVNVLVHHQVDNVMVTLQDDGAHLPAGTLRHIIRRLGASPQPTKQIPGNAGLSMYIAAMLSEALNGVFQIQQVKGKRAISLTLPRSTQMQLV